MPLQFTLPKRRKVNKMGVREPQQRIFPRHRRWVKSHGCCVPGCRANEMHGTPLDFAHLRTTANSGMGQKPHDIFGVSLCRLHHEEQHRIGPDSFGRRYRIDLWAIAREFARTSPDTAMREAMRALETT